MLCEIVGRDVEIETEAVRVRPDKSEVNRLLADSRLITDLTGWQSAVAFRDGLASTVDWISRNLHHFDTRAYAR
jgi:nucleoside-diphosphate-sugar epimerase